MMTPSNGSISLLLVLCEGDPPITGGFPSQWPVTRSFDVFFDLRLNKRLSKQSRRWRFETPLRSSCRHYTVYELLIKWYYHHYDDVTMSLMASQFTSLAIVYPTVYPGADQREHQSSASLAFVRGIHRGPVNSPHKWPVTRKMFPFDDVIMRTVIQPQQDKATLNFVQITWGIIYHRDLEHIARLVMTVCRVAPSISFFDIFRCGNFTWCPCY